MPKILTEHFPSHPGLSVDCLLSGNRISGCIVFNPSLSAMCDPRRRGVWTRVNIESLELQFFGVSLKHKKLGSKLENEIKMFTDNKQLEKENTFFSIFSC